MKSVTLIPTHKRVLIRVDYNVPLAGNTIVDARRIDASFATIDAVRKRGGTPLLVAHLGSGEESLRPIAKYLSKTYPTVFITSNIFDSTTHALIEKVPAGTVILFENIRRYDGEEKNTKQFAKVLASYADVYVNDAFSVSHRAHASVVGVATLLPSFAGLQLQKEIKELSTLFTTKKHPFVFLLGGAKFATKIPLISQFEKTADTLIITGAILNTFYKVAGFEIGESVVENGYDKSIKALLTNPKLLLPIDVVVLRHAKKVICTPTEIEKKDIIVDIGPQSTQLIEKEIKKSKVFVWNGPTGWYEKGFIHATISIANSILESTTTHAVIGGGDTGAVIEKCLKDVSEKNKKRIFVSTGGGATLEFLAHKTLVGIDALT